MLQILTIAAVSSLSNVIRLATTTKVQDLNKALDASFNGDICRFRSTHLRSEMYISKIVSTEVSIIKGVIFYGRAQPRVIRIYIFSIAVRGREKAVLTK